MYSKKGILDDEDELESDTFKKVPNSSRILKTNLKGDFIYGEGGKVYYYDSVSSSENGYFQPEPGNLLSHILKIRTLNGLRINLVIIQNQKELLVIIDILEMKKL